MLRIFYIFSSLVGCVSTILEDPMRPAFHFLPASNWMNDPNGPYYDSTNDIHHLFYQYLTPRTWGHAISLNLVDWEILAVALNYTSAWYTQVPGETAGVYSGSAFSMPNARGEMIPWLSVSVPTNDMMIFAYPANSSDPYLSNWSWYEANPVIFSPNESSTIPPGRDPTELWECTSGGDTKWCMAYATQESEGCPCSGVSGIAVFSATYEPSPFESNAAPGVWSAWKREGYLAADNAGAVMWECPDVFQLQGVATSESGGLPLWVMKYSIGPGPSFDQPWGTVGPRDYYVTGSYDPTSGAADSALSFLPDDTLWAAAMNRSRLVVLDIGAFYASKSYLVPGVGRVLWGWLPEERDVDGHGNPYGWAGAMSLPRVVIPYRDSPTSPWYVRTPPLQSSLQELRVANSGYVRRDVSLTGSASALGSDFITLSDDVSGSQLELLTYISVGDMLVGDICGLRVLSSITMGSGSSSDIGDTTADGNWVYEYTDIGLAFTDDTGSADELGSPASGAVLFVDPSRACGNVSAAVNRTKSDAYVMNISSGMSYFVDPLNGGIELHVVVDHSVLEVFAANGTRAATRRVYPSSPDTATNVQIFAACGSALGCRCNFSRIESWNLRAANITERTEKVNGEDGHKKSSSDHDAISETVVITMMTLSVIFAVGVLLTVVWFFVFRRKNIEGDKNPLAQTL